MVGVVILGMMCVMQWYSSGIQRKAPYETCEHRHLYTPPPDDPTIREVGFLDSPQ